MLLNRLLLNMFLSGGGIQGLPGMQGLPLNDGTNELLAKLGGGAVSTPKFKEALDIAIDALNDIEEASKITRARELAKASKTMIKEILER